MPTRVQNEATGGLISYFYTDAITNKPITIAKTETQVTNAQACIMLKELPYRFTRVRLTDATMIEVDNADEVLTVKHYYVNYNNGMVYFYPSVGSVIFTFTYDSIGYVYTTSTRIATQWDGTTVIETLQDMMDTMNDAILVSTTYANANALIIDIEARTLACKNSIDSKVTSANTSVDTKITEANNKITDVNTTITNANTARTNLQATIDAGGLTNYQAKTDNTLNTTSKVIVGAINENKTTISTNTTTIGSHTTVIASHTTQLIALGNACAVPSYVGSVLVTIPAGNGDYTAPLMAHGLGFKPRRVEAYIRADGFGYCTPFPITKHTTTVDGAFALREQGSIGVDETNVKINFIRKSPYIEIEESYFVDFYLYQF